LPIFDQAARCWAVSDQSLQCSVRSQRGGRARAEHEWENVERKTTKWVKPLCVMSSLPFPLYYLSHQRHRFPSFAWAREGNRDTHDV
jgi:hypothetical protein